MKKLLLILLVWLITVPVLFAQNSVDLKFRLNPDKVYKMKAKITGEMPFDIKADSAMAAKLNNSEAMKSMILNMDIDLSLNMTTGSMQPDTSFNLDMKFDNLDIITEINGVEVKTPKDSVGIKGAEVKAKYFPGKKLKDIQVIGSENIKNSIIQFFNGMGGFLDWPEKTIKTGETYSVKRSIQIPMGNVSKLNDNYNIETNFVLDKIENGKAYFTEKSEISMPAKNPQVTFEGNGKGKGIMIYNLISNLIDTWDSNMEITFKMKMLGFSMSLAGKFQTTVKIEVE